MRTLRIKTERYQFHYPNGKESGILGLAQEEDTEMIVNLDNFIMAIGHRLYFKVTNDEYIDMFVDEETVHLVKNMIMYSKYNPTNN